MLAADGTQLRGIVFKGLTLMGGGDHEITASLVESNVTGSRRSHYDAAGGFLIDLQAGLDISGTRPMVITLTSCFVTSNEGSGIRFNVPGGQLNLVNSHVSANKHFGNGGGIRVISGGLMLSGSAVLNNVAEGVGSSGGGISFEGSADKLHIHSLSTVMGNQATLHGGGLYVVSAQGALIMSGTGLLSNQAAQVGGGLYALVQTATLEDCLVFDNQAGVHGGGLALEQLAGTVWLGTVVVRLNRKS